MRRLQIFQLGTQVPSGADNVSMLVVLVAVMPAVVCKVACNDHAVHSSFLFIHTLNENSLIPVMVCLVSLESSGFLFDIDSKYVVMD